MCRVGITHWNCLFWEFWMYIYKELSQEMDENIFLIFLSTADSIVNPLANFIDVKNDLPGFILITFMIWKHVFPSEITTGALHIFRDIALLPVSMHNNDCGLHNLKVDLEKLCDLNCCITCLWRMPSRRTVLSFPEASMYQRNRSTVQGELNSFKVNICEHLWVTSHCIV